MPSLIEQTVKIPLASGKTSGPSVTQLGVPVAEGTVIKKGKLHELIQLDSEEQPARRFQNLRVTLVRTTEGGQLSVKLFLQLEAFGDDNVPEQDVGGFSVALFAGDKLVVTPGSATLFLPYARTWYENQCVFELPLNCFDDVDTLSFTATATGIRRI